MNKNLRYKSNNNFTISEVAGEKVILPVSSSVDKLRNLFILNETAAFIVDLLAKEKTLDEIATALTSEYRIDYETALTDIEEYVNELVDKGFFSIKN